MQNKNQKIRRVLLGALLLGLSLPLGGADLTPHARPASSPALHAPARAAGFGGVLVPKRVRMILGFKQTLPA